MILWNRPRSAEQLRCLRDEPLCREATQGNQEAFLVLFDRYWQQVFRLASSVIRDRAEAEDLAQALFLEVHTSMLRFDERRGSFRALLLRYAYTRAIDHRRRLESRQFYSSVQLDELDPQTLAYDSSFTVGLSAGEGAQLIEQALKQLDAKQSAVVKAYFFDGLSMNEIAQELGESFGNARHHLYRGLEKMRKLLAPENQIEESGELDRNITITLRNKAAKQATPEVSVVRARSI